MRREGQNRCLQRAQRRQPLSDEAAAGEGEDRGTGQLVGHDDRRAQHLHLVGGEDHRARRLALLELVGLDAAGDLVEHQHAFERVAAHGRLAGEHHAVGEFIDGVGDVGDLGARRHRLRDHRLEHVRGDDDGAAERLAGLHGAALNDGQLLVGALDAEVATGDHEDVARAHDLVEIGDGGLVLDLGDDLHAGVVPAEKFTELLDVGRFTHERHGDEVDAGFEADERVAAVLVGKRRQVDLHAGQIDVPARGELAGREHFATDVAVVALQHLEPQQAAIHEDDVADLDVVDQILVVDVDGADFLAALACPAGAHGEIENLARLQLDGRSDVAGANLRALDVHHDRHVAADAAADLAHALDDRAGPIVLGVRHVEADHVGTGADELFKHLFALGGGTERKDDLRAADGGRHRGGKRKTAARVTPAWNAV